MVEVQAKVSWLLLQGDYCVIHISQVPKYYSNMKYLFRSCRLKKWIAGITYLSSLYLSLSSVQYAACWMQIQARTTVYSYELSCSARELVKEVDYTLTTLSKSLLGEYRNSLSVSEVPNMYGSSEGVLSLIQHTESDAYLSMGLVFQLSGIHIINLILTGAIDCAIIFTELQPSLYLVCSIITLVSSRYPHDLQYCVHELCLFLSIKVK